MNRIKIKENSKLLLKKKQGACIITALLVILSNVLNSIISSLKFLNTGEETAPVDDLISLYNEISLKNDLIELFSSSISLILGFAFSALVCNQIKVGSCRFFLKLRNNHNIEINEIFKSCSDKTFLNIAKTTLIADIKITLSTFLLLIPGIVKKYEYAALPYILSVNPEMDHQQALNLSTKIMKGHKMELFKLQLSFIGWFLLSILTCGILAVVYVIPYYLIAEAEFFTYVKEEAIRNKIISSKVLPKGKKQ